MSDLDEFDESDIMSKSAMLEKINRGPEFIDSLDGYERDSLINAMIWYADEDQFKAMLRPSLNAIASAKKALKKEFKKAIEK